MIVRDQYNIIVQHNRDWPEYADGGDSAARTGIMALCGSEVDQQNLAMFVDHNLELVRHPTQVEYRNPGATSRDQLIQWAAGASRISNNIGSEYIEFAILCYADKWFINKDILTPEVKLYLHKTVNLDAPLWLKFLGYPLLLTSVLFSCLIRPNEEQNKVICMCAVMGAFWLRTLVKMHPDLYSNIRNYWSGYPWRDQTEIADALIKYIKESLSEKK